MPIDLTKLIKLTDAELEILMDNAKASIKPEAPALYRAAAVELFRRRGSDHSDPVIADCWGAIALLERARHEKTGQRRKSTYSRRSMQRNGEIAFMIDCARGKTQGTGFTLLVEAGLGSQTVEFIVATNPDRFPVDAVAAARTRLVEHGVSLPE